MAIFDTMLHGIQILFTVKCLALICGGTLLGIIFGAIPGLTATLAVTLLLPFSYILGPAEGIAFLIGIYVGGISGGLVSACLINIPGTPASIVTTFDGYPMAQNGHPQDALALGVFSSLIGGIFSAVCLVLVAPLLGAGALKFGAWEYFGLGLLGLSIVITLESKDLLKGVIAAIIGITISFVGQDPVTGVTRFTFGVDGLIGGFDLLATLMGFFAISEILQEVPKLNVKQTTIRIIGKIKWFPPMNYIKKSLVNFLRSSSIGTVIGILPGVGQSVASFIAYDMEKQNSKEPEKFGTGHYAGIVASESANNAVCGGALIPMITLGIPGDVVTAILLGGLMIHGLQPGPLFFRNTPEVVGSIYVSYILACIMMFVLMMGLMNIFAQIIKVPRNVLYPFVAIMCVTGVFGQSNLIFKAWSLVLFGVIGYFLKENNFAMSPLILGYILGPMIENNFRLAYMTTRGDVSVFFTRPISLVLLLATAVSIVYGLYKNYKKHKKLHPIS